MSAIRIILAGTISLLTMNTALTGELPVTFDADYTLSQDTVKAVSALGNPEGISAGRPKFDFEPMAAVNNGLLVGADYNSIRYDTGKNLPLREGALEIVVKNLNWEWDDRQVHMFLQTNDARFILYVYKHADDGLGVYLEQVESRKKLFLRTRPKNWQANSKHHLLLWFRDNEFRLYLDGARAASGEFPALEKWPEYFWVGPSGKFGRTGSSVVGRVTFYAQAPEEAAIAGLASKRLPGLKLAIPSETSGSEVRKVLPSSPWFEQRPRLGMEALDPTYVPPQWTPVKAGKDRGEVWNRTYDLGGTGLMEQIISGNRPLLASPAVLMLNGRPLAFSAPEPVERKAGRAIWRRTARAGALNAELTTTLEYDGTVWFDLKFSGGKPEDLRLEIPMTREFSSLIHYVGVTDTMRSVVAPDFSYSQSLPETPGKVFERGFCSHVWLGSNEGGLQFFAESDRFFFPFGRKDVFTVRRNGNGSCTLAVNMITEPASGQIPPDSSYSFGWIATPVKKLPDGWRGKTISAQYDTILGEQRGTMLVYWPDDWAPILLDPEPFRGLNLEKVQAKIRRDRGEGRSVAPYWSRLTLPVSQKGLVNPDALKIYDDWGQVPQRQRSENHDWMRCASTSPWSDYLVWCVDRYAERFGGIDGVYIDEMELTPNFSARSGGGYDGPDGKRRPTYSIRADRDLYKRMHYILDTRSGSRTNWSIAHASGTHMMEILSPFSVILTGEHLYSGYFPDHPQFIPPASDRRYYYSYALPLDRVRSEFYHRQWGMVVAWLPCLKNQKDIMKDPVSTRDMLSLVMQGDMLVWPLWCNADEIYKTWKFRREFDIGNPQVSFIPCWDNTDIRSSASGVAIGFYRQENRILAIVSNLNRKPVETEISFGKLPAGSVRNAETLESLPVTGGTVKLKMPRNDYIALRINY